MHFYKYHGAGNDFVVLDNRDKSFDVNDTGRIKLLCDRHFGIGADGMLLVEDDPELDFSMIYINSDGSIGAMCGNGGRCIVRFANDILKIIKDPENVKFRAVDGIHEAVIDGDLVRLKMQDVGKIDQKFNEIFLYSGTAPHNVVFVDNLNNMDICTSARKTMGDLPYPERANINYVEIQNGAVYARTYERGVEDETLACGTGASSIAVALHHLGKVTENAIPIHMPGGTLEIAFEKVDEKYQNIWLKGPTQLVLEGETSI